jgi:2-polyprenyl-3-methyl-5-hydroxy-6-metoxy-1,4-benzoquinol methylase
VTARAEHWGEVYAARDVAALSWFEAEPEPSLEMLDAAGARPGMSVIDVGAGASRLAGALLARGFSDVTALDVAEDGLALARAQLGGDAERVSWVVADLLEWQPTRRFEVWHDRAVFHFLTDPADRARYRALLASAVNPTGRLVMATFAEDGPDRCSALPTARYSADQLLDELDRDSWTVLAHRRELHTTPSGVVQPLTWLALRRDPPG